MVHSEGQQPPGWYYAHGDPPSTQRYWDGTAWVGAPQPVPGSEVADDVVRSAVPMPRIGARIIDWLIWAVAFTMIGEVIAGLTDEERRAGMFIRVITVLTVLLYETLMVVRWGATLGKMTLNLVVTGEDGSPLANQAVVRRSMVLGLVGLVWIAGGWSLLMEALAWPIILGAVVFGFVALFSGGSRQTPWDRLAGSIVVPK